ncbi:MAG: serine protease [bacterium]
MRKTLHEKILYPVTRVKAAEAGGSGVLVYSKEDLKEPGKFINVVLTCEHVVDKSIKVREEWDPVLKRDRKKEVFEEVAIEIFDYDGSKVISSNSTPGTIIAYDKHHDLAAVKLYNHKPMPHIASIIPEIEIRNLQVFSPVWVCGCSLLHDPFANPGTLTYLREIIEQKTYLMSNASSIFGNSGGGLFHGESFALLGLTSRITGIQVGFGVDIMTWMGFSTHPERLYEFFKDQELQFLYDEKDDYYSAMERRNIRSKEAMKSMFWEPSKKEKPEMGVQNDEEDFPRV